MKSLYEKINGGYVEVGDVKIPTLISTETNYSIGFWGQRHKEYLKEHHRVFYYNLLTQCKLNSYLHDIDVQATEMYNSLMKQFAESQGITEQLKAENQMLWVQKMNNIANQAREILYNKMIYT
ncbi:MAG: TnpV protein [Clostridium sp.]|nr:TnpV protein [Clostridium sp.]